MNRRTILQSVGVAGVFSLSGCVGARWWEDEGEAAGETDGGDEPASGESNGDGSDDTRESDTSSNGDEERNETSDESSGEDSNESVDEQKNQTPDENDTEVDRDQYEEQNVSKIEQRSDEDVEVDASTSASGGGGVTVSGTVTNVTDTAIDVVDLQVIVFGEGDTHLGSELTTVKNLAPEESNEFSVDISLENGSGEPQRVGIERDVYDLP